MSEGPTKPYKISNLMGGLTTRTPAAAAEPPKPRKKRPSGSLEDREATRIEARKKFSNLVPGTEFAIDGRVYRVFSWAADGFILCRAAGQIKLKGFDPLKSYMEKIQVLTK